MAGRLARSLPGTVVVHTDDLAWHESSFDWDHLLAAGVLLPLRQGGGVTYRPPAWDRRGRDGAIEVPAGCPMVVVEGVGAGRVGLASIVDALIWVQADDEEATRRGRARDGGTVETGGLRQQCRAAERAFLAQDRPWVRAQVTLCGTPDLVPAEQIVPTGPWLIGAGALQGAAGHGGVLRAVRSPAWDSSDACRC